MQQLFLRHRFHRLVGFADGGVVVLDGRRHIAGQDLAGVMIQRRHRHRSGVRMAAELLIADHRQSVGQHRHLMAVLLHVFRGRVPHQRPALDEAHPGKISEKVTADPHASASCSTISPNRASPSTSVIRTVRSALCNSAPSTKTSI